MITETWTMISTIFQSLPPLCKTRWWIPTATKVLALLNSSNNLYNPPKVSFDEFYNESLDHMDLMQVLSRVKSSSFSSSRSSWHISGILQLAKSSEARSVFLLPVPFCHQHCGEEKHLDQRLWTANDSYCKKVSYEKIPNYH